MAGKRDIYVPLNKRFAAHRPQASPNGKWVLLAEIANYGNWEPCRVVPMGGSSSGFYVGRATRPARLEHGLPMANGYTLHPRPADFITSGGSAFRTGNPSSLPRGRPRRKASPWRRTAGPLSLPLGYKVLPYGFTTRRASVRFHRSKATPLIRSSRRMVRSSATGLSRQFRSSEHSGIQAKCGSQTWTPDIPSPGARLSCPRLQPLLRRPPSCARGCRLRREAAALASAACPAIAASPDPRCGRPDCAFWPEWRDLLPPQ